ncbi:MAG: hypothetical protein ACREC5_00525 [Thermoplasmata archaeon]
MTRRTPGFRGFATLRWGQVVLIAIGAVLLAYSSIYLGGLGAIFIILVMGLFVPIYLGLKRPKILAIMGVAIFMLAAPLASVLVTQQTLQPTGTASSFGENGGDVLQDAGVSPFSAAGGSEFSFNVTIAPAYLFANTTLYSLTFFVSTCPEASEANQTTADCAPPFPSYEQVRHLPANLSAPEVVSFTQRLPGPQIYWWVVYADVNWTTNGTAASPIFLNPANGYEDLQGPVTGDFLSTLGLVIVPVYLTVLLYPGAVFLVALLFYTWFKAREARRRATGPGGEPPTTAPAGGTAGAAASTAPSAEERHCPKCSAVVYPNESQCWKCGAPLGATAAAPLPSSGRPPSPPMSP